VGVWERTLSGPEFTHPVLYLLRTKIPVCVKHSSVVKRTLGKSHDFDCAFDYDLIGQILFDFRSHSHLTFLREVEVMTVTLVMTKVMTTFITRYLPLTFVFVYFRLLHHRDALQLPHVKE
jgi:hypothetical protein